MGIFKVGDKVRWIGGGYKELTKNKIYSIHEITEAPDDDTNEVCWIFTDTGGTLFFNNSETYTEFNNKYTGVFEALKIQRKAKLSKLNLKS